MLEQQKEIDKVSRHPVSLIAETQGMNGYELIDWLGKRTNKDLENLLQMTESLKRNLEEEKSRRK